VNDRALPIIVARLANPRQKGACIPQSEPSPIRHSGFKISKLE
jgi:hypothetical protein